MAVIKELIRTEENGTISFGDYELGQKSKLSDYQYQGDVYKVKTFKEITKLERNGMFVYESVPGTAVFHLKQDGSKMEFAVEGAEDAQITVELEADTCLVYTSHNWQRAWKSEQWNLKNWQISQKRIKLT